MDLSAKPEINNDNKMSIILVIIITSPSIEAKTLFIGSRAWSGPTLVERTA